MKIFPQSLAVAFCMVVCLGRLVAQPETSTYVNTVLWPSISKHLKDHPQSYQYISSLVNSYPNSKPDSLHLLYSKLFGKIADQYNAGASIYVAEKMLETARNMNDPLAEANAHTLLGYYYDANGQYEMRNRHIDRAIEIYAKAGKRHEVLLISLNMVDRAPGPANKTIMFARIDSLISEVRKLGVPHLTEKAYLNSLRISLGDSTAARIQKYTYLLEEFQRQHPEMEPHPSSAIFLNLGKGCVSLKNGDYASATTYFLRVKKSAEQSLAHWQAVNAVHSLATVALESGNLTAAQFYLDSAETKAQEMRADDLLATTYSLKSELAKMQGNYKEALHFFQQKQLHRQRFDDRSKGFSMEKYFLQKEKEQLSAFTKLQERELATQRRQLIFFAIGIVLVLLLAAASLLAYLRLKKQRKELLAKNEVIEEQAKQLQVLDHAKSKFFANITHELRTPLSIILGTIHSIDKRNLLPMNFANLLETAGQSAKQLEEMINRILDLRKLETGHMLLQPQPTLLYSFCKSHLENFASLAQHRGIFFSTDISIDEGLVVNLDREKNRQVFYNLLSNAFKFTPAGKSVEVAACVQEKNLVVTVTDRGEGIEPADLPHIFKRFYQSPGKHGSNRAGTGIGLSLSSDLAALQGGSITVNSKPGEGSVFTYSLPLSVASGRDNDMPGHLNGDNVSVVEETRITTTGAGNEMLRLKPNNKPHVLLAEDDAGLQQYLHEILSDEFCVTVKENGKAAVEFLEQARNQHAVDIVVSDLMMPVMDGYELLRRIKSNDDTRHLPVIMLTARSQADDKLKALRIGVDDYITKPFVEEELLVRINNLIQNRQNREEVQPAQGEMIGNKPALSQADLEWLSAFEQFVRNNLADDRLAVSDMSEAFFMSESTLLRQLKRLTGLSPAQYRQEMRLTEARRILESGAFKTIREVAMKVGFADVRTFSRNFKARFGKLPSDY